MPEIGGKKVMFEEDDLPYEEEILRNPYSVKCWLRYIEHKNDGPVTSLNMIYERALKELPGSYKLWYNYLRLRRKQVKGRVITDPGYEDVNNAFERALVFMHKMPRIWLDYCQFLIDQCKITRTRRTFDRALRALPITQHHRIWPMYLKFVRSHPLHETAVRAYRRYLKLSPEDAEEYVEYLVSIDRMDEAALRMADIVNQENFVSKEGKSNHQLWHDLCELICKNPTKVTSLKVDPIIRGGIKRFTDERGKLWCSLADFYIRSGHFEKESAKSPQTSQQAELLEGQLEESAKSPQTSQQAELLEGQLEESAKSPQTSQRAGLLEGQLEESAKSPQTSQQAELLEGQLEESAKSPQTSQQAELLEGQLEESAKSPQTSQQAELLEGQLEESAKSPQTSQQAELLEGQLEESAKSPQTSQQAELLEGQLEESAKSPQTSQQAELLEGQLEKVKTHVLDRPRQMRQLEKTAKFPNTRTARDIYEEAIQTVTTVRDFTQLFDAYAQFEESMIGTKMDMEEVTDEDDTDLELRMERFEELMNRRPLLLNSVLLRQNPHNVHEWLKRVKLYEGKPKEIVDTFTEAVQTVDPLLATGKLFMLWVEFAKYYEKHNQFTEAGVIFEKGTKVSYTKVEDLAGVWCEWAEMELRRENFDNALALLRRATAVPSRKAAYHDKSEPVQNRLYKCLKVWSMYADLEESFGTFKSTKAVYDRIIDIRIATPQIIINYGMFLEENNYFEEAFKAYEKGIGLFKWPNVYDIWTMYLTKFIKRYGGKKLERARDLFEQCLEDCPAKFAKSLYLLYAKLEEDHGLARHAMAVYDRATKAVLPEEQYEVFNIYIKRVAEVYGVTHTRPIYEKAIEVLPDDKARDMCLRFADLERKLGEIDRARAVYAHCSQICDPRTTASFWQKWKEFEVQHGNEDTMREMLRIKRSVQATYNTQVNFMSAQMLAASKNPTGTVSDLGSGGLDDMKLLEQRAQAMAAESEADQPKLKKDILFVRGDASKEDLAEAARTANPDEITIEEEDEDESEDEVDEIRVQKKQVPSEIFGGLDKSETTE